MCREDKWIQPVKITIKIEAIDAATTTVDVFVLKVDVLSLDNIIMIYYTATHWIDIVTSKTVQYVTTSSHMRRFSPDPPSTSQLKFLEL